MPYKTNPQQFDAVLALSSAERSAHFVGKVVDEHFPGHHAVEISLEEFLSHWLPTLGADNVKVAVFPNKEWVFWIMESADLAQYLRDEAAQYE